MWLGGQVPGWLGGAKAVGLWGEECCVRAQGTWEGVWEACCGLWAVGCGLWAGAAEDGSAAVGLGPWVGVASKISNPCSQALAPPSLPQHACHPLALLHGVRFSLGWHTQPPPHTHTPTPHHHLRRLHAGHHGGAGIAHTGPTGGGWGPSVGWREAVLKSTRPMRRAPP
mgnify:CR=1 FL=1